MKYRVDILRSAEKEMARFPVRTMERIKAAIRALADNPRPRGCRKLKQDIYRIRVGDYRIVYIVDDRRREVDVTAVADRKDAYG